MAAMAGDRVDEDKAPEPIKSLLRALGEMGYAVAAWDADMRVDTHNFGGLSGGGAMPTGLVEFTIHVSAVRVGALCPPGVPEPDTDDDDDEFGDDRTGDEIARPLARGTRRPGWLPGDDEEWR